MAKTLTAFINENRDTLVDSIAAAVSFVPRTASCDCYMSGTDHSHKDPQRIDDEEIRDWILNDVSLYNWARESGVRI